jgi:hypothetical protein
VAPWGLLCGAPWSQESIERFSIQQAVDEGTEESSPMLPIRIVEEQPPGAKSTSAPSTATSGNPKSIIQQRCPIRLPKPGQRLFQSAGFGEIEMQVLTNERCQVPISGAQESRGTLVPIDRGSRQSRHFHDFGASKKLH